MLYPAADDPESSAVEYPYYQPQPPACYPLATGTSNVSTGFKRRRILRCDGTNERSERRNLYRWAKWCSDGTAALAQAEDRSLHVLETPKDLSEQENDAEEEGQGLAADDSSQPSPWSPRLISRQPTPIICATWYPSASQTNPSTYCFVTSTRDRPIRLIDALDGRNRGTYPILKNEQFLAPTCMTFNPDASKLYAGHDSAIDVFDFSQPGEGTRLKLCPSRKSKEGQKGIVSAITFSPDIASGMFAVGTFKGCRISCYSEDTGDERIMELDVGKDRQEVDGQGITQVRLPSASSLPLLTIAAPGQLAFHPVNPYVLFSASRQSDYISVYDIRNPAYGPYLQLYRPGMTQQRLGFDVDWAGRYLTTGGTDGVLRVYDINPPVNEKPILEYGLHSDSVGSVSSHPFKPWILTAYGSRRPSAFEQSLDDDDTEREDDSGSSTDCDNSTSSGDDSTGGAEILSEPVLGGVTAPGIEAPVGSITEHLASNSLPSPRAVGQEANAGWIGGLEVSRFA